MSKESFEWEVILLNQKMGFTKTFKPVGTSAGVVMVLAYEELQAKGYEVTDFVVTSVIRGNKRPVSRRKNNGPYTVGGDEQERGLPSEGAAISLALTLATRSEMERQFGVFFGRDQVARVERHGDGTISVKEVRQ